jgi:hypothetical protein
VGRDIPRPITLFFLYTRNRPVYSVSVVVVNRRIPQVISSKKNCSSHGTPRVRLRRHGLRWFARGRQSSRLIRGTDTRTHAELEGIVFFFDHTSLSNALDAFYFSVVRDSILHRISTNSPHGSTAGSPCGALVPTYTVHLQKLNEACVHIIIRFSSVLN